MARRCWARAPLLARLACRVALPWLAALPPRPRPPGTGRGPVRRPPPASTQPATPTPSALLRSRELWATIDVCNAPKQPDTVGIRGSMPGDGKPADKLYMSFGLEYLDAVNQWAALPSASSGWVLVGAGSSCRPPGRLELHAEAAPRRAASSCCGASSASAGCAAGHQFAHATLPTTAGRKALAGAEPEGFSAARCSLLIRPARTGGGRW